MKKTTLVIMAAGMGSRYGGIKQIEPVGLNGEIISDYSIFDALNAGFNKVVFIIKHDMDTVFREAVFNRISKIVESIIAYQELEYLPQGLQVPPGRVKPWGTGHAVLCAKYVVNEPFAVINADDFYGKAAFSDIYKYINTASDGASCYQYCMAGYLLKNTVTASGYVSRGVCSVDNGYLSQIKETTHIKMDEKGDIYWTPDENAFYPLAPDTPVSMGAWGFQPSFLHEAERRFYDFYNTNQNNIATAEYYLPSIVGELLSEKKAVVKVLPSRDMWHGFTYKEDKERVKNAIEKLIADGQYPERLWSAFGK